MRPDLLLNRLLDAVDLLHTVYVLVNRPGISLCDTRVRLLLSLQQQEIGTLASQDKGEGEPGLIGILKGVAHRSYILCNRLHGASLLQHSRLPMFLLGYPRQAGQACRQPART